MSPYNEDNTVDSSGYQGYHRSHHRSHTQDSQSEKIEVTIQGHTEESDSSQIEKKTKISLPWKHKGHILIFSLILSIFSIAVPVWGSKLRDQLTLTGFKTLSGIFINSPGFYSGKKWACCVMPSLLSHLLGCLT